MVRTSLLAVSLLAITTPLAAQQTYTWSSKRADAIAPGGVSFAHVLNKGQVQISYHFEELRYKGLWQGGDSIPLATALGSYTQVPVELSNRTHWGSLAVGLSDNFTLEADLSYSFRTREQAISNSVLYVTNAHQLGDLQVVGLYRIYNQGGYESHLQLGVLVPTGEINVFAPTVFSGGAMVALPYDMQIGAGTFAVLPGATVQGQNGTGSVGAQVRGTFYVGMNSRGYRLGNRIEMNGWAALKIHKYFSASMGARWLDWGKIHGARPGLNPTMDPANNAYFLDGQSLEIPLGFNVYMPDTSPLAGQRLTLEASYPIYRNYDGPQLGLSWQLHLGWQMTF